MIQSLAVAFYNRPDLLARMIESIDHPVSFLLIVKTGTIPVPTVRNRNVSVMATIDLGKNIGCAGAWNLIQNRVFVEDTLEHVLICGNDIRWAKGDLDIFANTVRDYPQGDFIYGNHSYSNFMIKRSGWNKIGAFDENFWPAYLEDADGWQRIKRTPGVVTVPTLGVMAHHEGSATVSSDELLRKTVSEKHERSWDYYVRKWGGQRWTGGTEIFEHPFNNPEHPMNNWQLEPCRLHEPHFWTEFRL